jgi:hypothetical protein
MGTLPAHLDDGGAAGNHDDIDLGVFEDSRLFFKQVLEYPY